MSNPSFDFASRNYETIRRDLVARAGRAVPEWTDRDPSDFAMALLELWAYMGDVMHYYIDRAAEESFLTSATQRESVISLANLFDYTPRFRRAAQGTISIANTSGSSITLPAYSQFTGSSDNTLYTFYSEEDTTILANTTTFIAVKEGSFIFNEVVTVGATGQVGQRYAIADIEVIPDSVQVFVYEDGETPTPWIRVDNITTVPANLAAYSVYVNASGFTEIAFGNRLGGRIPPVGARIEANYATCSGSVGNIPANRVTSFRGSVPEGLRIVGSSSFSLGSDGESIDSIKRSLRALTRAQERAVTLQDFADYANLIPGVFKAVAAYDADEKEVTVYALPFIENYTSYTAASVPVPQDIRDQIVNEITPRMLLGVDLTTSEQVELVTLNVTGTIYVEPRFVAVAVKKAVENALDGLLSIENLEFGQEIPLGEVYRTLMSVTGVQYVTIESYVMLDGASQEIGIGNLPPTTFLRKGTITFTTSGGITTSV
jgi:hypothetical protein